jgi:hypothetical protein
VFKAKLEEFKKIVQMNKKAFAQAIATGQPLRAGAIKGLLAAEGKFKQKKQAVVTGDVIKRMTKDGRVAIFDKDKKFVKFEGE